MLADFEDIFGVDSSSFQGGSGPGPGPVDGETEEMVEVPSSQVGPPETVASSGRGNLPPSGSARTLTRIGEDFGGHTSARQGQ